MRKISSLVIACLIAFIPLGAQAHDEVAQTNPAADQVVPAGKFDVSVTFDEKILASATNQGEVLQVTGPDSKIISNGCVAVSDNVLTTPIDVDLPGKYSVDWRSVSADGHATEGTFEFTVENASGYESKGVPAISDACEKALTDQLESENPNNFGLASFATLLTVIASAVAAVVVGKKRKAKS